MTAKFWDKRAERYDDLIQKHDAVYHRTIASAKSLLSTSDIVLDLGCASGEYSLDIAPFVRRVHGIDTSATMIALATEKTSDRSIGNVTFAADDVFDRALDGRGFTAVLAFCVLHLVEEIRPVLGRVNELLPAGGLFISQTLCLSESSFLFKWFINVAQKVKIVPLVLSLTALELEAAIADAGFDIAESERWERKKAVHWIVARKR
ncbi:MAG: methyltransferase domain-containing protein [Candidatus Aminicenantes bacterium]|nr:methyltransferase domain-containing protein [Candidatus Aminicenantes bacterium]